jgi:tight adherence protein C
MSPQLALAVMSVFVMIATVAGTATWWWMAKAAPEQRRIRTLGASASGLVVEGAPQQLSEGPDPTLARLSKLLPKSPKEMSRLQRRLARAGYPRYSAAVYFALAQLVLPAVVFLLILAVMGFANGLLPGLLAGGLAYVLPGFYIGRKTTQRKKAISNGLPDALDLLTVCVESGSGLDQAISKAAEELRIAHPALSDELRFIVTETRAGKPRMEAFKNFADRTGVEDVRSLVSMLVQTDRFGTSVGQALRTHADTSRTKRRQRAEERAGKVAVKLVFPLVLCLFPALYVVCFGPVVVAIYRAFFLGQY